MIKVLPANIANLIAAGEVIQRPSSVVKELMENAVDAGATQITLVVNDSGRTLVQVIDNGCGMDEEEAALCFERHATSKIEKAEDIYNITTYGFRGEALASIASCAEVTLKTKKAGEELGTEIRIAENSIISKCRTATPQGSNFAVRNIFYNLPARRKFLKSDNVEYRQILAEFTRIAIPKPDIEFKFIHNSRQIFHLHAVQNIKQRILQIEGRNIAKDLIDIEADTNVVNIRGFVGRPENAKKIQNNQYLFVNGRFFKSPMLHKSVIKAYANLIPQGYTPSYFIFLDIAPGNMDVNIHPTKTEIKFEDDSIIFEILLAAVKEAIGGNSLSPSIDFDREGAPEIPATPLDYTNIRPPKINYDPLFNPFRDLDNGEPMRRTQQREHSGYDLSMEGKKLFDCRSAEDTAPAGFLKIGSKYLITCAGNELVIIDIARAKERIAYERYLSALENARPAIQQTLFPQTVEVDSASFALLAQMEEKVKEYGFEIRPFGKNSIIVSGLPAAFENQQIDVKESIESLIEALNESHDGPSATPAAEYREKIALAMVKNIKYDRQNITREEAQTVIESILGCKNNSYTPSGRPIMKIIPAEELSEMLKK